MDNDEILSLIDQLKAQGLEEEQIMEVFYDTFKDGKMDREDLETLASALGYELDDDFKNEPTPDPIDSMGAEGVTEEAAEDLKEIKPGESAEDFKEKIEAAKEGEEPAPTPEADEVEEVEEEEKVEDKPEDNSEDKPSEEEEDDERKEAMKLFDLD